ncbi:unnamed protein product [Cyclocybe aegerita]|uniref:Transcription elongation regulator 1 n=1 Tax=Cyclocybe aegerita TaxID=1973307 RepID=A0A8S0W749_CYCAE|nr:unnamed protein product [Cyclocybe aegerita]
MSALPFSPPPIPALPQGWSEHIGPTGVPYYYNAFTRESTYTRPAPPIPVPQSDQIKKEKPLLKTPIPGTDWLKVTTTEGNIFYSHKVRKESVWVVPEELKPVLEALQAQERGGNEENTSSEGKKTKDKAKRKADESVPLDEIVVNKKAKVEDEAEEDDEESDSDEEEEDWQREAAAQLAAEAQEERKRAEMENGREAEQEAQRARAAADIVIPERVDLSIEEGKALFKTLLREKDINPLHPWDTSLPKFISDPRYVLLPSVTARREAFDEYCKERARELRQSSVKKEKEADPKEEFERLLKEEVKSTRASWTDFKRAWKKDRRFYGWGRDDREREKRFREFLKDLGEQKRLAAQRAEADFFSLLKENVVVTEGISWKEAKKGVYKDPRYDAVGSSSLREELFNTFVKGKASEVSQTPDSGKESAGTRHPTEGAEDRQERRNKAVKEREEKIRAERQRVDASIERSRMDVNKEEGERSFMTLLTDAIREPQMTWEKAQPQLKTDPRFTNSPLPLNRQVHLFHEHIDRLRGKQIHSLHALFETHAPSLATNFNSLPLEALLSSSPVTRLDYNIDRLEDEFDKWQRERTSAARVAFDQMLSENSFVEFWGRLGKIGTEKLDGGLKIEDDDIGEGEEEKVDMKVLAKNVDIGDMEKVLKYDRRYIMFDHVPEQRERWLRDYLSQLTAPKLSVHVSG